MSSIKTKGEKVDMPNSLRENIKKNLELIFIISMCIIIIFFITLHISINNLSVQTEKYVEDINLNNEKIVSRVEDLSNEVKEYSQVKIGRDQFTEIYMQLQELTGMISK